MKSGTTPSTATAHPRQADALGSRALDLLPEGFFACHSLAGNLRVAYGNRAFRELVGLPADEGPQGRPLTSLLAKLIPSEALGALRASVAARRRFLLNLPATDGAPALRLDLRPASGDGGTDWVGSVGPAEGGGVLELESAQVAPATDAVPAAIARWSIEKGTERLTFISQGARLLTGHSSADILREPELLFSGTDRDSRASFRRAVERAGRDLSPFTIDFPVRHRATDERRWLRLAASTRAVEGGKLELDGVLTDVTELKREERAVLATRNQLHALGRAVDGVLFQVRFSLDARQRAYLFVGEGSREVLGIEPHACVRRGVLFEDRVWREDARAVERSLAEAVGALSPWDIRFRLTDEGDDPKWVHVRATPGEVANDRVIFSGCLTDVTEAQRIELRLANAEAQLRNTLANLAGEVNERERAEQARLRLQGAAESLPGVLYRCEVAPDGTMHLELPAGSQHIPGFDLGALLAEPGRLVDLVHEDDRRAVFEALSMSASSGNDVTQEFRVCDNRGEVRWVLLTATRREEALGRVVIDGFVSDVTARKVAAQTLAETRTQLEHVTRAIRGTIYQVAYSRDLSARYLSMSGRWREVFGVEPELVRADPEALFSRLHPADRFSVAKREALARAVGSGGPYELEFRVVDDGQERWVRVCGRPLRRLGDELVYSCVAIDVSDAVRASADLQDSRRELRDVIETIPGAVFRCTVRDRVEITYLSEGARDLFGSEPVELTGPIDRLLGRCSDCDREGLTRRLFRLGRALEPWREELRLETVDGPRWLELAARGVKGIGDAAYYHGVITDATDAKLAEQRFADGEERLELALESVGLGLLDWHVPTGRVIHNVQLARMLGYPYQELGTDIKRLRNLEHARDAARKARKLQAHLNGDTPAFGCRYRLRTKDGEWRWVSEKGRVVERADDGGALRYVGTIQDVNDEVAAETRLEQQVAFSRLITKISSDFVNLKADEIDQALTGALRAIACFADAGQAYLCENGGGDCIVINGPGTGGVGGRELVELPCCPPGGWTWLSAQAARCNLVQAAGVEDLPAEVAAEREELRRRGVAAFLMVPLFVGDEGLGWLGFEFSQSGRRWDEGELGLFRVAGEIITQTLCRRRGERALEAAEAKVAEVARAVPGAVGQMYRSPGGAMEFRYLSRTITGCGVEKALADPNALLERIDERDRPGLERSLARSAADLTPWHFDYRTRNESNERIWVSAVAYPTRTPDGGTLFNGIAIDVTDKKNAELALKRSEERFRDLYESTPVMMHSTDARGQIVNVNQEWLRTLGFERAEVIGRRTEDFLTRGSAQTLTAHLKELAASDAHGDRSRACQMIRKDGALIDIMMSVRAERSRGQFVGASMSLLNVTDRNRALRALTESEERYRAIVRDQTDAICRFDPEGRLQFANAPCTRFLGRDATELEGQSWYEWVEGADRERVQRQLAQLSATDSLAQFELRMVAHEKRWYQWTVRAFFSAQGEPTGYQAVGRDIQELKALEREIREISHREQQRIGHDLHDGLGQELTGVSLMLKTLEQAASKHAPQLRPQVRALRDMVGKSIATTRALAQGLSPVHLEQDGFAGALSQLAANTESVYGTPVRYSVVRGAAMADPAISTDLYRIAQEALSNAARHACARQITLRLDINRNLLCLEIIDDGRGIVPDACNTDGMGLKIMRYRAGIIGASLEVLPREGGGTIVRCTRQQLAGGANRNE